VTEIENSKAHLHPGSGRRSSRPTPKGRQVDPKALEEVRALLGTQARQADLLIEFLHRIQDRYHQLSAAHLTALAHEMRLALTEVYEVATFYAHFDVALAEDARPAGVTVRVCDSLSCWMQGAQDLLRATETELGAIARVVRAPCMGRCDTGPVAEVGHRHLDRATTEGIAALVAGRDRHAVVPAFDDFARYQAQGGYDLARELQAGKRTGESIIAALENSGLRGLGGAGFPTGRKWRLVAAQPAPRLMAINADEGEPGTFKDRYFLEREPHRVLEGMLLAARVVGANAIYFYLRDEYPAIHDILRREIPKLVQAGLADGIKIELRRGAGAYICGEESAMLESIEGKRGLPRHKPPYPAEVGLFGRPTLIQNVETLYWIPEILARGADWFAAQGRRGRKGLRTFSVSGRVRAPGVKIAPAGISLNELLAEHCGGMQPGHVLRGYLPGGASGGILPASLADEPLDFGTLEKHGCFIGSAAIVVLSDKDDLKGAARNLMRFFEDESCGQCTPCRSGTEKAVQLMSQPRWDAPLLHELAKVMADASICGLGQAAPNPLLSLFRHFPEEFK
jgi:formate dehydrogenase beta subunit